MPAGQWAACAGPTLSEMGRLEHLQGLLLALEERLTGSALDRVAQR